MKSDHLPSSAAISEIWKSVRSVIRLGLSGLALLCAALSQTAALAFTIVVQEADAPYGGGAPVSAFTYMVNVDNTGDPFDPDPLKHPLNKPRISYSPIVAAGDQSNPTVTLPDGRYLISVRAAGYKLWGQHVRISPTIPDPGTVTIELTKEPLPLSRIVIKIFHDFATVDGFPEAPEFINDQSDLPTDMSGFRVVISDGTGQVTVDWFGNPLCTQYSDFAGGTPVPGTGGDCVSDANGNVIIENIPYGKYEVFAIPPDEPENQRWVQLTTFEGGLAIDAWQEEGTDGRGAPGEILIEPFVRTAYFFGFVAPCEFGNPSDRCLDNDDAGTGSIMGRARNWVGWPPFEQLAFSEPVYRPWVAVNDIGNNDTQVARVRGNPDGTFTIPNVPPGTYQLVIWDDPLNYIMRFITVQVADGQAVDLGDVGVFRWFGWVSGHVFQDANVDGIRDPGETTGIPRIELLLRERDGSIRQATTTDDSGYYEFPQARSRLGLFDVLEVGFGRLARTGHSVHDEHFSNHPGEFPDSVTVIPGDLGGALLLSQLTWEGRRSIVDFGKRPYNTATGENGGVSGGIIYATTRNEFNAKLAAGEDYEPGIPGVTVRLWGLRPDGNPTNPDDYTVLLNEIQSDTYVHPNTASGQSCDVKDKSGSNLATDPSFLGAATAQFVGDNCIEVPMVGNETKQGAWDGGWAIETKCPNGWPCAESEEVPLPPGDYVVEVVPPPFYQMIKEEDQNTDEGSELVPLVPPPPCVGPLHLVNDPRNPYNGLMMPLCNKKQVTIQAGQNTAADFFLFTTANPYIPNVPGSSWSTTQAVPPPGRFFGLVEDDLIINRDPTSPTYGEPRGVPHLPIGVYESGYGRTTVGRRIATIYTDEYGFYEVLLPSTFQANCPIPGGVCQGMYVLIVNDPGDTTRPNAGFNKDYLTEPAVREIWPGKYTSADTPVDPLSTLVCSVPPDAPQIFAVDLVHAQQGQLPATITIKGTHFGSDSSPPTVTLDDDDSVIDPITLAVTSWVPGNSANFEDTVTVTVPAGLAAGPYQLMVKSGEIEPPPLSVGRGGKLSRNGLTFHVLGTGYTPPVVDVFAPPTLGATPIQDAIDAAAANSLVVVHPGTYHENVIMHKNVKLQGFGPGGAVGAGDLEKQDFPCPDPVELCPPVTLAGEDPFAHIQGSVIDGRFFTFDAAQRAKWQATLTGPASPYAGPATVPGGAGISVVVNSREFGSETGVSTALAPRIDGLGITASRGEGGGGIYVHAFGRNLRIKNNIVEANQSRHGGGISIGRPVAEGGLADNQNDNIVVRHNRILNNGGVVLAGGVGIFNGATNYDFTANDVCGNYSSEYGGGISHWGLSPGGRIRDNNIYYNDAFDEGGGINIAGELGAQLGGVGSGPVDVLRNLVQANLSGDDGGGIRLLRPLTHRINIINNFIVNNVAADFGGGIALDDASDVVIVNNTVVGNVSTSTAEDSMIGTAHGAGLVSEVHSAGFQAILPVGSPNFSNPVMFNNIFWDNLAYRWGQETNEAGQLVFRLIEAGSIDLEVFGTAGVLNPQFSLLSVAYAGGSNNIVGVDPRLMNTLHANRLEITVTPNRLNLTELSLFMDRPEGTLVGFTDSHLLPDSVAINAGTAADPGGSGVAAPAADIDGNARPFDGGFDIGADESLGAPSAGVLVFTAEEAFISEGIGTITLVVNRVSGSAGTVTVDFFTAGTPVETAVQGTTCRRNVDFIRRTGTLTFGPGVTTQSIVVTICDDTLVEAIDDFLATLTNPGGGAILGTPRHIQVHITDND